MRTDERKSTEETYAANTRDPVSPGAVKLRTDDRNRQTNKGPHKSPVHERMIVSFF